MIHESLPEHELTPQDYLSATVGQKCKEYQARRQIIHLLCNQAFGATTTSIQAKESTCLTLSSPMIFFTAKAAVLIQGIPALLPLRHDR